MMRRGREWEARMFVVVLAAVALAAMRVSPTAAQEAADALGPTLMKLPAVQSALAAAKSNEPQIIEEQVRLCEIAAPPFKEAKRAAAMKEVFTSLGLRDARIDSEGNVIGDRPGLSPRPRLVMAAHLDTVFPEQTDVHVSREGTRMKGPGIGDDCRGLAVLVGVIRALDAGKVQTEGSITFVANVGEEGLGDLRGVKHLFSRELRGTIDRFVSVDGAGVGITNVGVGSRRYRVTYKGPGGHSFGAFGMANPIHALGRAIAKIGDFQVPSQPKTTFNVGRVGGGTSVNSIAFEAWMEVDMRSSDAAALRSVDASFLKAVDQALEEENDRWDHKGMLTVVKDLVGERPAGRTAETSPIVRTAISVTKALDLTVQLEEGSTDSNVPMNLGIPAITIDGGGRGAGAHSLGETFDSTDSWRGTQRAVLLAIALSQK